jgi:hypothetical protein
MTEHAVACPSCHHTAHAKPCPVRVDSAWTQTNDRPCGCSRDCLAAAPAEVNEPTCARDRDDLPEPPLKDDGRPSAKICVCGHRHGDGIVSARKCPRAGCDCQAFASCRPATPPESAPSDAETCDHAALRNVQCGPCGTPALAVNALAVKRARTSASSYAVELREIAALIHTSASRDRDDGEDAAADQKRGWADRVLALAAKMEGSR